ncbi:hypothetical protein [Oryza sativa Japonica Group]|uniref:Uncharacterized protein n=1 Tax=Oryza sativa subsp. japonica TaxID=39947 RepID=Q5JLB3_ORYSJ|nr:hypothetical protein [Oryza sativa Japonica Group]BAD87744.1 hypothetical protein [Oryza sativa Japonica Group]
MPSPRRAVNLRWSSLETEVEAAIAVEGGCGVDLAMVGRALGLDPATVRLNGYFVSRGRGHVSSAVTWRALLDFFAARGLPTGDAPAAPVAVHGKPAPPPPPPPVSDFTTEVCPKRKFGLASDCTTEVCPKRKFGLVSDCTTEVCPKRKFGLYAGKSLKKSKNSEDGVLSRTGADILSDEITLGLKRRLKLDDANPAKKMKQIECNTETQQPVKFSCSFINGHGKRSRDEEMITSFSCKRVR